MMYPPTTIAPQPLEIAATPHIKMEEVATTVTAPAPPAETKPANGSRALSGVPPPIFNRDREKSEHFLDKFMSYEIVNGDARQFTIPYLKVALCLSYLNGPKVDAWARQHCLWLKNRHKQDGILMTDKSLWEDFELLFRTAYTDQDAKITTYQKLNNLRMQGSNINSYIADFDRLVDEARYNKFDMGVMIKFKEGLQPSLLREILLHTVPAPNTLTGWCQKARERQMVYKELKNAGLHHSHQGGPTDLQKKWAQKLGLKTYQTPHQRTGQSLRPSYTSTHSQVIPMDIDAGTMGGSGSQGKPPPYQGRGGFTQLSDAKKADLIAKRACFKCKQPGHISRWCGKKKPIPENARSGPTPGMSSASATNVPGPKKASIESIGGVEGIYDLLKNRTEAEKEKFINLAQDF